MMELKIKDILEYKKNGVNKTKIVFSDSGKEKEIIFEGSGKIKIPVKA